MSLPGEIITWKKIRIVYRLQMFEQMTLVFYYKGDNSWLKMIRFADQIAGKVVGLNVLMEREVPAILSSI
jgi:hypothetical protein